MDLKDKLELEMLRILAGRIVELIDSHSTYDWRNDLKKYAAPINFSLSAEAGEDVEAALEAAMTEVAACSKLKRQDLPTLH